MVDYYSAVKRDTALTNAATWVNHGNVTLRERIQTHKNRIFYHSLSVKGPELGKLCSAFLFSWQVEITIAAQYVVVKFETDVGMVVGSACLLNVRQGGRKRDIQYFYFGSIIFFFFFKPQIHPSLKKEWMGQKSTDARDVSRIAEGYLAEKGRRRETFFFQQLC